MCRPFAKGRDGLLISEGAGILVLETVEHAKARGRDTSIRLRAMPAMPMPMTLSPPTSAGMTRAMQAALADALLSPAEVSYINAHGTGTKANDMSETAAIEGRVWCILPADLIHQVGRWPCAWRLRRARSRGNRTRHAERHSAAYREL